MGFRTVCIENRCKCSYSGGYLVVSGAEQTSKIHLSEISAIVLCTTQAYVSAYLISELAKARIPLIFCDEKSLPISEALPLHGYHRCVEAVQTQIEWTLPAKKRMWQRIVRDKIIAQAEVLESQGHLEAVEILRKFTNEVKSGDPTNREAAAASIYFPALFGVGFNRDANIPVNAALNYGYAILLARVSREIISRGKLTQLGVGHRNVFNQWNLSCDFMEPFRPLIDLLVVESKIEKLDKEMKRKLINFSSRLVAYRGGEYKVSSVISLYVKNCIDSLDKKIEVGEIESYSLL